MRNDTEKDEMLSLPQSFLAKLISCRSLCPMVEFWGRELFSSAKKLQVRHNLPNFDINKSLGLDMQETFKKVE